MPPASASWPTPPARSSRVPQGAARWPRLASWRRMAGYTLAFLPFCAWPQSQDTLQQLATELITAHSSQLAGEPHIQLAPVRLEQRQPCTEGLSAFLSGNGRLRARMNIGFRCAGPQRWSLYAPAEIALNGSYLAATVPIQTGDSLDNSKVQRLEGNLLQQPADVLTDWTQLTQQQARQRIAAGQPIRASALRHAETVLRGSTVKLIIEGQGFSVSTEGLAMEDGAPGQTIQVRNPAGAILSGRVRNAGTIDILH